MKTLQTRDDNGAATTEYCNAVFMGWLIRGRFWLVDVIAKPNRVSTGEIDGQYVIEGMSCVSLEKHVVE